MARVRALASSRARWPAAGRGLGGRCQALVARVAEQRHASRQRVDDRASVLVAGGEHNLAPHVRELRIDACREVRSTRPSARPAPPRARRTRRRCGRARRRRARAARVPVGEERRRATVGAAVTQRIERAFEAGGVQRVQRAIDDLLAHAPHGRQLATGDDDQAVAAEARCRARATSATACRPRSRAAAAARRRWTTRRRP